LVNRLADIFARKPALAVEATPLAQARLPERQHRLADAVLSILSAHAAIAGTDPQDEIEPSLAMVEVATTLWTRVLRFDGADPSWPDRDRVIVAQRRDAQLVRAVLELCGIEAAEFGRGLPHGLPGVDSVASQPGQALAYAVGTALGERMMAARFGKSLVDHRTWLLATPADLMGGLSYEAASLAGDLKLSKLAILVDDTPPTAKAPTAKTITPSPVVAGEDMLERFAEWGWATKRVGTQDPAAIASAFSIALRARKPVLIACRRAHPPTSKPSVTISEDVREAWRAAGARSTTARRGWLKRLARHAQAAELDRVLNGRMPDGWRETARAERMALSDGTEPQSTLAAGRHFAAAMVASMPELVGASTVPTAKRAAFPLPGVLPVDASDYAGRHICFSGRDIALPGVLAGIASRGGLIVSAQSTAAAADSLPQTLRALAREGRRLIHIVAEEPLEDAGAAAALPLASLRAIPNLLVLRPAGAIETVECWELALQKDDGPSVMLHSTLPTAGWRQESAENACARGGYVAAGLYDARAATLIASGAELAVALDARSRLAQEGILVAVVSLPCWSLFASQNEAYRADVLGEAPRFAVEPGSDFGWGRWLGPQGQFIGAGSNGSLDTGRPGQGIGITAEALVVAVKKKI
jgi:transketolase